MKRVGNLYTKICDIVDNQHYKFYINICVNQKYFVNLYYN